MYKDLTNRVVDEVFKERALYKKLCGTGNECTNCGLCLVRNSESVQNIIKTGAERISSGLGVTEEKF